MKFNTIKRTVKNTAIVLMVGLFISSCSDYLDVVPDDVATLDHAFANRFACEGYLFTCYSYLPATGDFIETPDIQGADEFYFGEMPVLKNGLDRKMKGLTFGMQNTTNPIGNVWDGQQEEQSNQFGKVWFGQPLYNAIRDCNIFLENVHRPYDLEEYERKRWVAEVKFLKAYYHFYLMRMYGPVVLIKENLPVSASPEQMALYRTPFDECVKYVSDLLDEAVIDLPEKIQDRSNEMGRATQAIALSVKAQLLTMAASPLFNGNPDYANVVDNRNIHLFSTEKDEKKWTLAADACKAAIEAIKLSGGGLLLAEDVPVVPELVGVEVDTLKQQYNLRAIMISKWNKETVWGSVKNHFIDRAQRYTSCKISSKEAAQVWVSQTFSPTFDVVEAYYTKNGVPMEEDRDFDNAHRYEPRLATAKYKWYIREGEYTAGLHFDREPRFYASVGFNRAIWWGNGVYDFKRKDYANKDKVRYIRGYAKNATIEIAGKSGESYSFTGYWAKKLNSPLLDTPTGGSSGWGGDGKVPFPIIRAADIYLLYAETLNETASTPPDDAYVYLDLVRARAGLKGVKEAWHESSIYPEKPLTKDGFREIIHRERRIELAMEGARTWDLRRWKEAENVLNKDVRVWNIDGVDKEDYYNVITVDRRSFTRKEYLWPIKESNLSVNKNLLQNYGW